MKKFRGKCFMSEAQLYTKEQADSSFAPKSHSHSNYATIFTGAFTNRDYFTCYIPGPPAQFTDWKSLVRLLERQYTSVSTSLGCWGLFTNSSGQNYSIIGLHFGDGGIVFDCQGPINIGSFPHPVQGGNLLSGKYSIGGFRTDRADKISWLQNRVNIPTSY